MTRPPRYSQQTFNRNTELKAVVIIASSNVHTKAPLETAGENRTQLEGIFI